MSVTVYAAFIAMYYARDAAYDVNADEELRRYLSGANPFLFKGEGSADPAVYPEFEQAYKGTCGDCPNAQEALAAVRGYLKGQDVGVLIAAFDSVVDPGKWEECLMLGSEM